MKELEVSCKEGEICQIGMVVRNLEKSIKKYWYEFRLGPWYIWKFEQPELREVFYKGIKLEKSGFKLALAGQFREGH